MSLGYEERLREPQGDPVRIIKKYGNRRLYDTSSSGYVNLDDVITMIRGGESIQVVEAKTGEDLTRHVLLQAMMESSEAAGLFPPALLHRIIRYSGDDPMQKMVMKQLAMGMEMLDAQVGRLEGQFPWMGMGRKPGQSGASRSKPSAAEPAAAEAPMTEPSTAEPATEPEVEASAAPEPAPAAEEAGEMDALRAKLAALEARLKG